MLNTMVPLYANVAAVPAYLGTLVKEESTDSFYWNSRLIGALADASYAASIAHIERYQAAVVSKCRAVLNRYDAEAAGEEDTPALAADSHGNGRIQDLLQQANTEMAAIVREETGRVLARVLDCASNRMRNAYARSDA